MPKQQGALNALSERAEILSLIVVYFDPFF
jgi:hypothetical protein